MLIRPYLTYSFSISNKISNNFNKIYSLAANDRTTCFVYVHNQMSRRLRTLPGVCQWGDCNICFLILKTTVICSVQWPMYQPDM